MARAFTVSTRFCEIRGSHALMLSMASIRAVRVTSTSRAMGRAIPRSSMNSLRVFMPSHPFKIDASPRLHGFVITYAAPDLRVLSPLEHRDAAATRRGPRVAQRSMVVGRRSLTPSSSARPRFTSECAKFSRGGARNSCGWAVEDAPYRAGRPWRAWAGDPRYSAALAAPGPRGRGGCRAGIHREGGGAVGPPRRERLAHGAPQTPQPGA